MNAAKWAFRLAAAFAVLGGLLMLVSPVAGLLGGAVHAAFAWGIRKRQRWAGVARLGFLLLPIPFAMQLSGMASVPIIFSLVLQMAVAGVVLMSAVDLWRDPAASHVAWPWLAGVTALAGGLVCLRPYVLPTGSMQPTILQNDYFLAQTRFWSTPQCDELVVRRNPADPRKVWVKRVVGIAGDRLRVVNKQLFRNGAAVVEPYVVHRISHTDPYRDNFPSQPNMPLPQGSREVLSNNVFTGEVVVPAGQYFVMGDNRAGSLDSRYLSFVPVGDIVGRPVLIYASYQVAGHATQRTAFNTRWDRLFKVL